MTPLEAARADLGYMESPAGSNRTKYGEWYGMNGVPWCMEAVQYWHWAAGQRIPYKTASCSELLSWYRANMPERIVTEPRENDICIFTFGHVGIVESAGALTVTCIEGNTSLSSDDNGGAVMRRTRKREQVQAFIRAWVEEMSYETFKEYMTRFLAEQAEQPLPGWAKGEFQAAIDAGITDGTSPMGLIPRYQAALMAVRAREDR